MTTSGNEKLPARWASEVSSEIAGLVNRLGELEAELLRQRDQALQALEEEMQAERERRLAALEAEMADERARQLKVVDAEVEDALAQRLELLEAEVEAERGRRMEALEETMTEERGLIVRETQIEADRIRQHATEEARDIRTSAEDDAERIRKEAEAVRDSVHGELAVVREQLVHMLSHAQRLVPGAADEELPEQAQATEGRALGQLLGPHGSRDEARGLGRMMPNEADHPA